MIPEPERQLHDRSAALAARIVAWEQVLDNADNTSGPLRYLLSHARSEWSVGQFDTAERDLDRMDSISATAVRAVVSNA